MDGWGGRTTGIINSTPLFTTGTKGSPAFFPQKTPTQKGEHMIKRKRNSGQSTIEFLLIFVFILAFIFSSLKLSFVYTNGYLVHYATFMASRAYMVVDTNSNTSEGSDSSAQRRAQEVFSRFPLGKLIKGYDQRLQFNEPDENGQRFDRNLYVGVYTDFVQRFGLSPFAGGQQEINFRSESFLGREPTRAECVERICQAIRLLGGNCQNHTTVFDNGC